MKKLMLLLALALVAFSSCSQDKETPEVKPQEAPQKITLHIEGEREPVPFVDDQGKAISLTGHVSGSRLTSIDINFPSKVKGIVCLYDNNHQGFIREVEFTVQGRHISFLGEIELDGLQRGQLQALNMDVYIGGDYTYTPGSNGPVTYKMEPFAIPTQEGMDLSVFNPIFVSRENTLTLGTNPAQRDYNSLNLRFRLFGQFLSFRFRNPQPAYTLRFDALYIGGGANQGFSLQMPWTAYPTTIFPGIYPTGGGGIGKIYKFRPAKTLTIPGNATANNGEGASAPGDPAYTVYIWSEAQTASPVRFGWGDDPNTSPFSSGQTNFYNKTNYRWGSAKPNQHGRFFNAKMTLTP